MPNPIEIKNTSDIYGVLYSIKTEYDSSEQVVDFKSYSQTRLKQYIDKAYEWLADDENQQNEKHSEDLCSFDFNG